MAPKATNSPQPKPAAQIGYTRLALRARNTPWAKAKIAGPDTEGRLISSGVPAKQALVGRTPPNSFITLSALSMDSRTRGILLYRSRPMPTSASPGPPKRKAMRPMTLAQLSVAGHTTDAGQTAIAHGCDPTFFGLQGREAQGGPVGGRVRQARRPAAKRLQGHVVGPAPERRTP